MRVNQQDVVPTLAYLTGIPIPVNNFGSMVPEFIALKGDDAASRMLAWRYNAGQVSKVMERNIKDKENSETILLYHKSDLGV